MALQVHSRPAALPWVRSPLPRRRAGGRRRRPRVPPEHGNLRRQHRLEILELAEKQGSKVQKKKKKRCRNRAAPKRSKDCFALLARVIAVALRLRRGWRCGGGGKRWLFWNSGAAWRLTEWLVGTPATARWWTAAAEVEASGEEEARAGTPCSDLTKQRAPPPLLPAAAAPESLRLLI